MKNFDKNLVNGYNIAWFIYHFMFAMAKKYVDTLEPSCGNLESQDKINGFNLSNEELGKNLDMKKFVKKIAWIFHESWRKSRIDKNGVCESIMEKSEDEEWTKKHRTEMVDIVNTKFEDLPSNWQRENLEAAKVAVGLVYKRVVSWEEITSEMIEEMAGVVHIKWLERNWVKWSFENQRVDYENLSEEEKEKDRAQIELAIQIIKSEK